MCSHPRQLSVVRGRLKLTPRLPAEVSTLARGLGRLRAVRGQPMPTTNDGSPQHLNWSEPWASSVPLVSGAGDQ